MTRLQPMSLLFLAIILKATTANAQTGNDLRNDCDDNHPRCTSYIAGYAHGLGVGDRTAYCPPSSATNNQVVEVVKKYIKSRPQMHHLEMSTLIYFALQEAFPCKR